MIQRLSFAAFVFCFSTVLPCRSAPVGFNRDVRPLLSDTCFHCHGHDKNSRKADLRLDLRESALLPAKSGAVPIVPGKPEESEIIKRLISKDADEIMPPPEAHKVLTADQIETLRRWVAEGAVYEEHWAYTPLKAQSGKENELGIDGWVAARLAREGLEPSPPADPATLYRRVFLDLLGLPPTPEEVQKFLADSRPDAFASAVDALLANPHFGERWAVWWLDLARFSDTVGYHGDQNNRAFPYRDYVVQSFNANKRFDAFTTEQLAGDLLPNAGMEQRVATGFNRLNMVTREGGAQPGEYLAKYGAERTRTVSNAFLGSTFGCAECHDHKFDPISAKDFYSLQAFFADVKQWGVYSDYKYTPNPELAGFTNESPFPPEILVDSPFLQQQMGRLEASLKAAAADAVVKKPKLQAAHQVWQAQVKEFLLQNPTGWERQFPQLQEPTPASEKPKAAAKGKGQGKGKGKGKPAENLEKSEKLENPSKVLTSLAAHRVESDGSVHAVGDAKTGVQLAISPRASLVTCVRLEALPHADFKNSILRSGKESAASIQLSIRHQPKGKAVGKPLGIYHAEANLYQASYTNGRPVEGVQANWNTVKERSQEAHTAVYVLETPLLMAEGDQLILEIPNNLLGHFTIATAPILQGSGLTAEKNAASPALFLTSTTADKEELGRLRAYQRQILECNEGKAWTLVTEAQKPLEVRILPRGNWMDATGPVVEPAVPHFLPNHPEAGKRRLTRLDLAQWLMSPQNPITARVVVNRVWKQFFGNGLSSNLDDVGFQGDPPSHPELLDCLAAGFRDGGWNFKQLVRTLVLSKTYQQSSNLRKEVLGKDPNNRWLASQNPRRLDAEFIRDNALAISGLLNVDIGGPSVKPYQPDDYYAALQFPSRSYKPDLDDRQWRRGVYMHWQRTFLHPMLANFDAPMRDECTANRTYSNTPQQALTLLNDPTFTEAAQALAIRLLEKDMVSDTDKLHAAYQRTLGRSPKPTEMTTLLAFLATQRDYFTKHPDDALKASKHSIKPTPSSIPAPELAAWSNTCRVLLNLHETITRY